MRFNVKFTETNDSFDTDFKSLEILKGEDGVSPIITTEKTEKGYKLIITDKEDTEIIEITEGYIPVKGKDYFDGKDGQNGKDGQDGITPQKGVDYYTPEEQQEIIEEVLKHLSDSGDLNTVLSLGKGTKSLIVNEGIALGHSSIAGGTTDTSIISSMVGLIGALGISLDKPTASGIASMAFGTSTIAQSVGTGAFGVMNVAGIKGLYYTSINFDTKEITLSTERSYQSGTNLASTHQWKKGDTISFVNGNNKFTACSKIESVNGNIITVDSLPFKSAENIATYSYSTTMRPDAFSIIACYEKSEGTMLKRWYPRSGEIELGWAAIVLGACNLATGMGAVATGYCNWAAGDYSHTEGKENIAGYAAHVEGENNKALGMRSHGEGFNNIILGDYGHGEGKGNTITGINAHGEGQNNQALGQDCHVEGRNCIAEGDATHAQGLTCKAIGAAAFAAGRECIATGARSFAGGWYSETKSVNSIAYGFGVIASGQNGQAVFGRYNNEDPNALFIIGDGNKNTSTNVVTRSTAFSINKTSGVLSFTLGKTTVTEQALIGLLNGTGGSVDTSELEERIANLESMTFIRSQKETTGEIQIDLYDKNNKLLTKISDINHFQRGTGNWSIMNRTGAAAYKANTASGAYSIALGNGVTASNDSAVALGYGTTASGLYSFAAGYLSRATGTGSTALGYRSEAIGYSIAAGYYAKANYGDSYAFGEYVSTSSRFQFVTGRYNSNNSNALFIIGDGTNEQRHNALEVIKNNGFAIKLGNTTLTEKNIQDLLAGNINGLPKVDEYGNEFVDGNEYIAKWKNGKWVAEKVENGGGGDDDTPKTYDANGKYLIDKDGKIISTDESADQITFYVDDKIYAVPVDSTWYDILNDPNSELSQDGYWYFEDNYVVVGLTGGYVCLKDTVYMDVDEYTKIEPNGIYWTSGKSSSIYVNDIECQTAVNTSWIAAYHLWGLNSNFEVHDSDGSYPVLYQGRNLYYKGQVVIGGDIVHEYYKYYTNPS